jgi:hypothetical protein
MLTITFIKIENNDSQMGHTKKYKKVTILKKTPYNIFWVPRVVVEDRFDFIVRIK